MSLASQLSEFDKKKITHRALLNNLKQCSSNDVWYVATFIFKSLRTYVSLGCYHHLVGYFSLSVSRYTVDAAAGLQTYVELSIQKICLFVI